MSGAMRAKYKNVMRSIYTWINDLRYEFDILSRLNHVFWWIATSRDRSSVSWGRRLCAWLALRGNCWPRERRRWTVDRCERSAPRSARELLTAVSGVLGSIRAIRERPWTVDSVSGALRGAPVSGAATVNCWPASGAATVEKTLICLLRIAYSQASAHVGTHAATCLGGALFCGREIILYAIHITHKCWIFCFVGREIILHAHS